MKDILYAFGIVMLYLLMLSMVFKVVKADNDLVDESSIHVNLNNIENKELIKI